MKSVCAANWFLIPSATYRLKYDDNHLLTTSSPVRVYGQVLDLDSSFRYNVEKGFVELVPKLSISRLREAKKSSAQEQSEKKRNYNTESYFLNAKSAYSFGLMGLQLSAGVTQDSTELNSEEFIAAEASKTRNLWNVNPSLKYQYSERINLNLGIGYFDVRYAEATEVASLVDYFSASTFVALAYALSENIGVGFELDSSWLKAEDEKVTYHVQSETQTNALNGEFNYTFSERDLLTLSFGYRNSNFYHNYTFAQRPDSVKNKVHNYGYLFDFRYDKRFQGSQLNLTLGQFADPNGAGQLTERIKFTLNVNYDLSLHTKVNLGLTVVRIENIQLKDELVNIDSGFRVYSGAQLGVTKTIARDWFVSLRYNFRSSHFSSRPTDTNATALSNSGQLVITYTPRKSHPFEIY